jgi:hypothetical protein
VLLTTEFCTKHQDVGNAKKAESEGEAAERGETLATRATTSIVSRLFVECSKDFTKRGCRACGGRKGRDGGGCKRLAKVREF